MSSYTIFLAILAVSLFNGLASPWVAVIYMIAPVWFLNLFLGAASLINLPEFLFYFSSLIVSTATLLIGGVPAALFEHLMPSARESPGAMLIWLGGVLFLTVPALQRVFFS